MAVTAAEVSGCKGRCKSGLSRLQSLLCDGGHAGQPFEQGVRDLLGGCVRCKLPGEVNFTPSRQSPKRWVIERSFAQPGKELHAGLSCFSIHSKLSLWSERETVFDRFWVRT